MQVVTSVAEKQVATEESSKSKCDSDSPLANPKAFESIER